jgi:hypothetical protein
MNMPTSPSEVNCKLTRVDKFKLRMKKNLPHCFCCVTNKRIGEIGWGAVLLLLI